MQNEVRFCHQASTAFFGKSDVPLSAHSSGCFYAWLKNPLCKRDWEDSGKVYGYRKLHDDLCDEGESVSPNRVARLAKLAGIQAQIGYKGRPSFYGGKSLVVVDNRLDRQFEGAAPDMVWVTDITYIRTDEGFVYLTVVIDLHSRRIIGWSMHNRQPTELVLQALLTAVWRNKPKLSLGSF